SAMLIVASPRFEEHVTPPGHPERPERAHVFDTVAAAWARKGGNVHAPRPATKDELVLVHDPGYVEEIDALAGKPAMLDADTFMSPESRDVAVLAAGAAVQAAEHALEGNEPAFALVRPPGHHAERNRAMGFCLFNSIAVAAAAMRRRGLERIAIVDIDVHHGNGTQAMFYSDSRVLYVSTHQYPFYPGTGAATETGHGEGLGFTVNVPMEAGSNDADFLRVHEAIIAPVLEQYKPQLTLVSAGYDAHERDPLASMRMTTAGYTAVVASLRDLAARHGALALVTEGGYELRALTECLSASIAVLDGGSPPVIGGAPSPASRADRAISAATSALREFWQL
ncbi:MAG TPA: histone deacetylase, partial [Vicinamibacterales bacterium]|nr:histone deacetylase [Vicinamibacterales bacterium]